MFFAPSMILAGDSGKSSNFGDSNPIDVDVVPNEQNNAGRDGYVVACDCTLCN